MTPLLEIRRWRSYRQSYSVAFTQVSLDGFDLIQHVNILVVDQS